MSIYMIKSSICGGPVIYSQPYFSLADKLHDHLTFKFPAITRMKRFSTIAPIGKRALSRQNVANSASMWAKARAGWLSRVCGAAWLLGQGSGVSLNYRALRLGPWLGGSVRRLQTRSVGTGGRACGAVSPGGSFMGVRTLEKTPGKVLTTLFPAPGDPRAPGSVGGKEDLKGAHGDLRGVAKGSFTRTRASAGRFPAGAALLLSSSSSSLLYFWWTEAKTRLQPAPPSSTPAKS